jgi:iron complex outermembrane recepter protein
MMGDYGSYRGSFDLNQHAFGKAVAIRVNGVYSNRGSYRQHAYSDTQRIHLAAAYRPIPKIRIRAEFETGDVEQVIARNASLFDGLSAWTVATANPAGTTRDAQGRLIVTNPAGVAAFQGVSRYPNTVRVTYVGNTGESVNMQNRNSSAGPGRAILDPSLVDPTINTGGPGQRRHGYFRTVSAFYEHQLGARTFIEAAYNHQEDYYKAYILSQGAIEGNQLRADLNQIVGGVANPNVGRYMLEGIWNHWRKESRSDNTRLTLSTERDAGKWGHYRVAVMGEYEWRNPKSYSFREVWAGAPFAANPEAAANNVFRRNYVTPGDWASYMVTGPAAFGLLTGVPNPAPTAVRAAAGPMPTLSSTWVPFNQNQSDEPEYQTTYLVGGQARYFNGRIVAGVGFRKDSLKFTDRAATRNPVTQFWETDYANSETTVYSGNTRTLGVVGHVTQQISVFYNMSNNFALPITNIRLVPDSRVAGNPESSGRDVGVAFSLLGDRVNLRLNYYETENDTHGFRLGGTANNPTVLLNRILDTLSRSDVGILTPAQADARRMNSTGTTFEQYVEGYEFRITANPTKNWRFQANYSYTDGYETNIAPEVVEWAATVLPEYERHGALVSNVDNQTIAQLIAAWREELADTVEQDGLSLPGNRKHKVNVLTRYSFDRGFLRGLYIGAGYRHQSKRATNVDANRQLIYGNSYWLANGFAGYRFKKIWFAKDLNLQLNVENLFDYDEPIVLRREPSGLMARWNRVEPRTWRLTANLQF